MRSWGNTVFIRHAAKERVFYTTEPEQSASGSHPRPNRNSEVTSTFHWGRTANITIHKPWLWTGDYYMNEILLLGKPTLRSQKLRFSPSLKSHPQSTQSPYPHKFKNRLEGFNIHLLSCYKRPSYPSITERCCSAPLATVRTWAQTVRRYVSRRLVPCATQFWDDPEVACYSLKIEERIQAGLMPDSHDLGYICCDSVRRFSSYMLPCFRWTVANQLIICYEWVPRLGS